MAPFKILAKSMIKNEFLRLEYKKIRDNLSEAERIRFSEQIAENLENLIVDRFANENNFLCYYPTNSEVSILDFYQRLLDKNYNLYFPVSENDFKLSFYKVADLSSSFCTGKYGIKEPKDRDNNNKFFSSNAICLTPGLVFDKNCNRIGYGAGFYDRFFAKNQDLIKVALAFDCQFSHEIEPDKYDVRMDYIVSNSRIIGGLK